MSKLRALAVLNLRAMLSTLRLGGGKGRTATGVGALLFLAGLGTYLSGIYSFLLASQLAPLGMVHLIILLMPVLVVGMGATFTVFAAQGVVFGGRDNDIMLPLPVPPFFLLLGRTIALYAENLVFAFFVMLPAGVAYLVHGGAGGALFLLRLLIATLFLTLLPTSLDLVAGFLLAWASGRFARRALVNNILYMGAFLVLLVLLTQVSIAMQNMTAATALGIERGFGAWGVPFLLFMEGTAGGDLGALLLFMGLTGIPFLLVVWLFAGRYQRIVTRLGTVSSRSDYRLRRVGAAGAGRALLAKEAKRFFSTPIYFFNAGFGLVAMVAGGVASLFFRGKVEEMLRQAGALGGSLPITPILAVTLAFLVSMTAITASSISLEGKQLWILKEAPVSVERIFAVKAGFQLLAELPCLLVSTLCLAAAFSLGPGDWLLLFLPNAALAFFGALFGLFVNLAFPKLDATNDAAVVKQSAAALLGTLLPMGLALGMAVIWVLSQGALGGGAALVLCTLLPALGGGLFLWLLHTRGRSLWQTL